VASNTPPVQNLKISQNFLVIYINSMKYIHFLISSFKCMYLYKFLHRYLNQIHQVLRPPLPPPSLNKTPCFRRESILTVQRRLSLTQAIVFGWIQIDSYTLIVEIPLLSQRLLFHSTQHWKEIVFRLTIIYINYITIYIYISKSKYQTIIIK
jgi:hypothetical protein